MLQDQDSAAAARAEKANRAATFHPCTGEGELPAIEVAGVLVSVFLDRRGQLRVLVDIEEADPDIVNDTHEDVGGVLGEGMSMPATVPMEIHVGERRVWVGY
ncbi:hypothetical protein AB0C65_38565 [Nocardia sp. NPDC048505]|uniref:hypothetical protein n=1 Tax=Nocardia sp. NPDC048505 TaxID=3155756 RepID=UPI003406C973